MNRSTQISEAMQNKYLRFRDGVYQKWTYAITLSKNERNEHVFEIELAANPMKVNLVNNKTRILFPDERVEMTTEEDYIAAMIIES